MNSASGGSFRWVNCPDMQRDGATCCRSIHGTRAAQISSASDGNSHQKPRKSPSWFQEVWANTSWRNPRQISDLLAGMPAFLRSHLENIALHIYSPKQKKTRILPGLSSQVSLPMGRARLVASQQWGGYEVCHVKVGLSIKFSYTSSQPHELWQVT